MGDKEPPHIIDTIANDGLVTHVIDGLDIVLIAGIVLSQFQRS